MSGTDFKGTFSRAFAAFSETLVKDAPPVGTLGGHVRRRSRRGHPRKGAEVEKAPARLEEMLEDLPKACGHGARRNTRGFLASWRGDKR